MCCCFKLQVHFLLNLMLQVKMHCQSHCQLPITENAFSMSFSSQCPSLKCIALLVIFRTLPAALFTLLSSMACYIMVRGLANSPPNAAELQQLGWLQRRHPVDSACPGQASLLYQIQTRVQPSLPHWRSMPHHNPGDMHVFMTIFSS